MKSSTKQSKKPRSKSKRTKQQRTAYFILHPTVQVMVALSLFVLSVILTRGQQMTAWEEDLFVWIYEWPDFLLPFFFVFTQLGTIYALGIFSLYFLVQQKYHKFARVLLTGTLTYQLSGVAKDLWGRTRPNELLPDVVNLDYIVRGPGFPSGHVALAVAIALTLGHYLPDKYRWVVPVWIIGVALSRIYLGIHAPLDILGGFAIGWFAYAVFRHVRFKGWNFDQVQAKMTK